MAGQPVANTTFGFAGSSAGDWSKPQNVIGPADNNCSNMGATDKINLVSNFGFDIPLTATITGVTAHIKASSPGGQGVGIQLASDATIDPADTLGDQLVLAVTVTQQGNCAVTDITDVGNSLASWNINSLLPSVVNNPAFGLVFSKLEQSTVKVDSICLEIGYETDVLDEQTLCFQEPPPQTNTITVFKILEGAAANSVWEFDGDLGAFTLPADGGFEAFADLIDGSYTITETTKSGYTVSVECEIEDTPVASGSDEVTVSVAGAQFAVCTFTNTENTDTFTVNKDFSDGNTASVTIALTCTSGTVATNNLSASEASAAVFTVNGASGTTTCTAVESGVPAGYTGNDADCQDDDSLGGSCTMVNTLDVIPTAMLRLQKIWTGAFEDDAIFASTDGLSINAELFSIASLTGDTGDPVQVSVGDQVILKAEEFEPGSNPDNYDISDWECDDDAGSTVAPGGMLDILIADVGKTITCTVTNTFVFFEGIPVLNRYGLALLALLMLGIGVIGFRRFS